MIVHLLSIPLMVLRQDGDGTAAETVKLTLNYTTIPLLAHLNLVRLFL